MRKSVCLCWLVNLHSKPKSQGGVFAPARDIWQLLKTFVSVEGAVCSWLLGSSQGCCYTLQCTGRLPTTRSYPAPNVSPAEVEKLRHGKTLLALKQQDCLNHTEWQYLIISGNFKRENNMLNVHCGQGRMKLLCSSDMFLYPAISFHVRNGSCTVSKS